MEQIILKELSEIRFGFYGKASLKGKYNYIQSNYFSDSGLLINEPKSFIDLEDKDDGHILQEGDVLFISKGFRYFAWCYRESFGPAVASTIFFVIRPDKGKILPEYLTAFINMPKNQDYFKLLAAGSSTPSIRKSELENVSIPVLSLEKQQQLVELYKLHIKEIELLSALEQQKTILYQSMMTNILK